MNEKDHLEGIDGWLILVAIGIVIAPFRIAYVMYQTYPAVLEPTVWNALTTPGSDAYHPLWAPVLIAEILINAGMIVLWVYVAYMFFTRSTSFPKWLIFMATFTVVFILCDILAFKMILPNETAFDSETTKTLAQSAVYAAIWIPYMLVSKRVKATFGGGVDSVSHEPSKGAQIAQSILDFLIACSLGGVAGLVTAYLGYPQFAVIFVLVLVTGYMVHARR